MRKVEIKRWVNYYPNGEISCCTYESKLEAEHNSGKDSIRVELTGYVELPERKVEITESMIDDEYETFLNDEARFSKKMVFRDYLKQKLFGSGEL